MFEISQKKLIEIADSLGKNRVRSVNGLFGIQAVAEIIKIVRQNDKEAVVEVITNKIVEASKIAVDYMNTQEDASRFKSLGIITGLREALEAISKIYDGEGK